MFQKKIPYVSEKNTYDQTLLVLVESRIPEVLELCEFFLRHTVLVIKNTHIFFLFSDQLLLIFLSFFFTSKKKNLPSSFCFDTPDQKKPATLGGEYFFFKGEVGVFEG